MTLPQLVWDATKKYIHSLPHPPKKKLTLKSNGFNDLENLDAGNSKGDHIKLDQYKQAKLDLSSCGYRFYLLNQVFRASLFSMNRIFECQVSGFLVEDNLPSGSPFSQGWPCLDLCRGPETQASPPPVPVARPPVEGQPQAGFRGGRGQDSGRKRNSFLGSFLRE